MPTTCPPIHPGEILNEEFLSPLRITQYRLAKAIGVDPRRIHAIVHGERGITAETALLFSRFFGNSANLDGVAKPVRPGNRTRFALAIGSTTWQSTSPHKARTQDQVRGEGLWITNYSKDTVLKLKDRIIKTRGGEHTTQ